MYIYTISHRETNPSTRNNNAGGVGNPGESFEPKS